MSKSGLIGGIITVVVLLIVLGQLPSGDVTDSKSAIRNAQQGLAVDTVVKAGGEAIKLTGDLAVDSACRDGVSQGCSITTTSVNMIGIAYAIFVVVIVIIGAIAVIKFGIKLLEWFEIL